MDGRDAVQEELFTLFDGPLDACLISFFGCLRLLHQADERLRNINVEASRKQVDLLLRRDGFESRNNRNGDASLSAKLNKREELLVVEEHLRHDIVCSGLDLLAKIQDVALQIGCLEVLLGITRHADAEVGGMSVGHCGVEILSAIQVANHLDEFRTVREAVGLGQEVLLSWQSVASQSHDVIESKEVKVQQFALDATA